MITRTFSFLTGITNYREKNLKIQGIRCWEDFLSKDYIDGIPYKKKEIIDQQIIKALKNLECKNEAFFYEHLPNNEHWRLYDNFKKNCAFLDIETTGLDQRTNKITTISIYDGKTTKTFIRGVNLDHQILEQELNRHKMIVTYNGALFDIPFIKTHFPKLKFSVPHMDLRWSAKRVGMTGGLKALEKRLGITRDDDIVDMNGKDAVRLWKRWERNEDKEALKTLIKYNKEDVINLKTIADIIYNMLSKEENEKESILAKSNEEKEEQSVIFD